MKKYSSKLAIILLSYLLILNLSIFVFTIQVQAEGSDVQYFNLTTPPTNLDIRNPGNLPFIHDANVAYLDENDPTTYGVIKNERGYRAFGEALVFGIDTLIKLVGVMSLFGILEGIIRLVVGHGEEEVYSQGIKMIMWSLIGLCLSLAAHAIITGLLQFLTGVSTVAI